MSYPNCHEIQIDLLLHYPSYLMHQFFAYMPRCVPPCLVEIYWSLAHLSNPPSSFPRSNWSGFSLYTQTKI